VPAELELEKKEEKLEAENKDR